MCEEIETKDGAKRTIRKSIQISESGTRMLESGSNRSSNRFPLSNTFLNTDNRQAITNNDGKSLPLVKSGNAFDTVDLTENDYKYVETTVTTTVTKEVRKMTILSNASADSILDTPTRGLYSIFIEIVFLTVI